MKFEHIQLHLLFVKRLENKDHSEASFAKSNYSDGGGEIYGLCVNADDQVVGTSDAGVVYLRDGVSQAEPTGRSFVRLVERVGFDGQKWTMILQNLCEVNEACWEAFRSTDNGLELLIEDQQESAQSVRQQTAKLRVVGEKRFRNGVLHLESHQMVFHPATGNAVLMPLQELTSSFPDFDVATSTFCIILEFRLPVVKEMIEIGFVQELERDEWHELLQQDRKPYRASVCLDACSLSQPESMVSYGLSLSLLCGTVANQFTQKTEVVKKVTEYQKYAFLRGFTSFQGASNGVTAWMGGDRAVSGLYTRLPSREWTWIDSTWSLVDADKYEEGWTYAESIDGSFSVPKNKKDRVRRRCWQRRSRYEGRGPWIAVESPPIRSLDIQKAKGDRTLLWAVTRDRQVLLRQGVTEGHPQGTTWKHIVSDFDIAEISVASPTCVWAITGEGRLLRRQCLDQTDMECIEVLKTCPALPKAVFITTDRNENLYYCDGSRIVKLGKFYQNHNETTGMDVRVADSVSEGSYVQFCLV
ncbi:unnamed protein product [Nippostrongylus brasiliensis]|uniref:Peroxin/Ferlin domain-containing protein n=1 Tax=Nippostrongylus brasiliensis TaxID=27835 RepID=A0A0N4YGW9_NIPBR|nr:unnamed protein product [Nippostrongylus brasiliensis]